MGALSGRCSHGGGLNCQGRIVGIWQQENRETRNSVIDTRYDQFYFSTPLHIHPTKIPLVLLFGWSIVVTRPLDPSLWPFVVGKLWSVSVSACYMGACSCHSRVHAHSCLFVLLACLKLQVNRWLYRLSYCGSCYSSVCGVSGGDDGRRGDDDGSAGKRIQVYFPKAFLLVQIIPFRLSLMLCTFCWFGFLFATWIRESNSSTFVGALVLKIPIHVDPCMAS